MLDSLHEHTDAKGKVNMLERSKTEENAHQEA